MALSFPDGAHARLAGGFAAGLQRGAAAIRLPSAGRRHGSSAGTDHGPHHRRRIGAAGAAWCGAIRRERRCRLRLGHARRRGAGPAAAPEPVASPTHGASPPRSAEHLRRRYLRPEPRLGLGAGPARAFAPAPWTSRTASPRTWRACAAPAAAARRCGSPTLPLSPAAGKALAADPRLIMAIAAGGDDYEILACVAADKASDFVAAARAAGRRHDPHRHPQPGQRRDLRRRGRCSGLVSLLGLGSLLTRTCGSCRRKAVLQRPQSFGMVPRES